MRDLTNTTFREYHLLRCLGQSTFSSVYLGEHIHLKTLVAIKLLQAPLSEMDHESFRNEARLITRIRHANIVAAHTYGIEDGIPFIVMDYAPNGTLRHRYPTGTRLSHEEIMRYVTQVADALQYIHDQEQLIHCDVKPENMLLGPNEELWLSDFGASITVQASSLSLIQEEISATVQYVAPEQVQGEPRLATDQYALGVVVYEWLAGSFPFDGPAIEVSLQHIYDPPPSLRAKVPTISPAIEEIVFKALAKDPRQRFPSVRAFADALIAVLEPTIYPEVTVPSTPTSSPLAPVRLQPASSNQEESVLQLPEPTVKIRPVIRTEPVLRIKQSSQEEVYAAHTPTESIQMPQQPPVGNHPISRRAITLGLAGLVFTLGGSVVVFEHFYANNLREKTHYTSQSTLHAGKQIPRSTARKQTTLGTTLYTYRGHSQAVKGVTWLSDQFIASGSLDRTVRIWNVVTGSNKILYTQHSVGVKAVAASPHGKSIASGDGSGIIHVWDAASGRDHFAPLYDGQAKAVRSLAWSPNGRYIASGSDDSTVSIWDAQTGNQFFSYTEHSGSVLGVSWSPDGRFLASGSDDHTVQIWSATSRVQQALLIYSGHTQRVWDVAWSPDGKHVASASQDGTIQVWNATIGSPIARHEVPANRAESVAWSPDGKYIAGGSDDGTVQVWNATTAQLVLIYHRQHSTIWSIPWSPNGLFIASASNDSTVQVWQAGIH